MKRASAFLVVALAAGCGASHKQGPLAGESTAADSRGPTPSASAAPAHRSNAIPADYKTTMTHVGSGRFVSRGHAAGRFDCELFITNASSATLTTASGEFPVGTRLVQAHYEKTSSAAPAEEAPGPLFMMEKMPPGFDKDHGDWRFVALSSIGELVEQGKIESCVGCHDDAPHDHVFVTE